MYAVIDIGSNTIRLVIYKREGEALIPVLNKKSVVGLAGYINRRNRMKKKGIAKAIVILREFRDILDMVGVDARFPFATAALRNIENSAEVIAQIKEEIGLDIQVLSGHEEAFYDYHGVLRNMELDSGLLIDIGGGSTELVFYREKQVILAQSLPIGSLNMHTRFVSDIIPSERELLKIRDEVKHQLTHVAVPADAISEPICGVGGSARAVLSFLHDKGSLSTQCSDYACGHLREILLLLENEREDFIAQLLKTSPDRIHTFLPGLVILATIAEHYQSESISTSPYGVREGYLYAKLEERGDFYEH